MRNEELHSREYWDRHAASDPLWAVLSFPEKSDGRWTLHDFMKNGEREVALLFQQFMELKVRVPTKQALDFGCGVGRLTQAFARRMSRVIGADISPAMIDMARRLNHYPERAEYLCTAATNLETLPSQSFECIYTNMVLQHVPPNLSAHYLNQLFRVLEPGGAMVFQLPSHKESRTQLEIIAMPNEAYAAEITLEEPLPARMAGGTQYEIALKVRNISSHEWRQAQVGPVAIGNHWLEADSELMLVQDDGRAPALQIVPTDFYWLAGMTVRAPARPGRYVLEIDLVHEGVTWFAHKGSLTLRLPIEVAHDAAAATTAAPAVMKEYAIPDYPESSIPRPSAMSITPIQAEFPMYGIPRDEVMAIIARHGARLVYLEEDRRAGPEWVSYRYFVIGRP